MGSAPDRVLLYAFGGAAGELGVRVRQLGYEAIAEDDLRAAAAYVGKHDEAVRAALLPAGFALQQRGGELDQLQRAAGAAGIRFVAVGAKPGARRPSVACATRACGSACGRPSRTASCASC